MFGHWYGMIHQAIKNVFILLSKLAMKLLQKTLPLRTTFSTSSMTGYQP